MRKYYIFIIIVFAGSGTETVAQERPDGSYSLHGFKWFTSAADSEMALTLARIVGPDGQIKQVRFPAQPKEHETVACKWLCSW